MQKSAPILVACLLAIAAAGASAQTIWKWRDASGQVHVSDTPPPPDVPEKNILKRPSNAPAPANAEAPQAAAPAAAASGVDTELQKKKARADQEKAAKEAADKAAVDKKNAAIKADNCQRAQTDAKALQSGVRISRVDANGERSYLDDKQRADELQRTQQIIQQNCK
jgi:hypothetical protein